MMGWVLAALVVVAVAARALGPWLLARWEQESGAFGHGPLVLAIGLPWLVLLARRAQRSVGHTPAMLLALPASALLWMLCARGSGSAGALGAWLALLSLLAALGGWSFLKALFPVLGFLFFALPWPLKLIDDLSLPLRDFALQGGLLLAPEGVVREGEGARLIIGEGRLLVGDVCSGLRSSVSLLAVAWMFAALMRLPLWRFALCVTLAPVCAVIANALRVAFLVHAAARGGIDAAAPGTLVHDGSGIAAFVVAAGLLLLSTRGARGSSARPGSSEATAGPSRLWFAALAVGYMLVSFLATAPATPQLARDLGRLLRTEIDSGGGRILKAREIELEAATQRLLQPQGWVYRTFGEQDRFSVCVVYGAGAEVRIHAPEICYRGNGFEIESLIDIPCPDGFPESPQNLHELHLLKDGERRLSWAFYRAGGESTSEYNRFVWRTLWRPEQAQTLVLLSTRVGPGGLPVARDELRWFLAQLSAGLGQILTLL